MDRDEVARIAKAQGLERMLAAYPEALAGALSNTKALAARLPRDVRPEEEPAHVFSLAPRIGRRG